MMFSLLFPLSFDDVFSSFTLYSLRLSVSSSFLLSLSLSSFYQSSPSLTLTTPPYPLLIILCSRFRIPWRAAFRDSCSVSVVPLLIISLSNSSSLRSFSLWMIVRIHGQIQIDSDVNERLRSAALTSSGLTGFFVSRCSYHRNLHRNTYMSTSLVTCINHMAGLDFSPLLRLCSRSLLSVSSKYVPGARPSYHEGGRDK